MVSQEYKCRKSPKYRKSPLAAPWGTLGGTDGKTFYAKIFSPKIIYPITIFREFFGKLFPLVLWPDRGI